jgi:cell division inhibitor SulA
VDTGYPALSAELPGGGWPIGTLIDLMVEKHGLGELRLLRPVMLSSAKPIALLEPPHEPNGLGFSYWGVDLKKLTRLRAPRTSDALWSAEQILRSNVFGILLFWQKHMRHDSLRRLHLAAQESETLFFMIRPSDSSASASPAPLRLEIRAGTAEGTAIDFVKRRGPAREDPLILQLDPVPALIGRKSPARRPLSPVARPLPADLEHH